MDRPSTRARVREILGRQPLAVWSARAASFVAAIGSIGLLICVIRLVDLLSSDSASARWKWLGLAEVSRETLLLQLLVAAISFAFVRSLGRYFACVWAVAAASKVGAWFRRAIYLQSHRVALAPTWMPQTLDSSSPWLLGRIDAVTSDCEHRLSGDIISRIELLLIVGLALFIHPRLAIAAMLLVAILLLIRMESGGFLRRRVRQFQRRANARLALLAESLRMMPLVKSHRMEAFNHARVERQIAELEQIRGRASRWESGIQNAVQFLGIAAIAIFFYAASQLVLSGALDASTLLILTLLIATAYRPIRELAKGRRLAARGSEAAIRIFEYLDQPRTAAAMMGELPFSGVGRAMEFRKVSLRTPDSDRSVLDQLDLTIPAGERIGFVGLSEAEKNAMISLLAKIVAPSSGSILCDDIELGQIHSDSWSRQIGLALASQPIFGDTVAHNIGCGQSEFSIPRIIESAKTAHAHGFIQKLPYGYETPIGELGSSLRPGEQFRIALARAALRSPSLYIIEEPEEPLDDETSLCLEDAYARVLTGRTAIFFPQQESTIRSCDRLYFIHEGRLEASGEHGQLIEGNELYRQSRYVQQRSRRAVRS